MKSSLSILLFSFNLACQGQNLILNGDFEEFDQNHQLYHVSISSNEWASQEIERLSHWSSPTAFRPFLKVNRELAHSGKNTVDVTVYYGENKKYTLKTYVQGELVDTLIREKTYRFTCYVRLMDKAKYSIKDFGVYFSNNKTKSDTKQNLPYNPQLMLRGEGYLSADHEWQLVSGEYVAKGGEQYFIIGDFRPNKKLPIKKVLRGKHNGSIYFLDDMTLTLIDSVNKVSEPIIDVAAQITKDSIFILNNLYFDIDSDVILPESYPSLDSLSSYLNRNNQIKVSIIGHTDNSGLESKNIALSENRAHSVKLYLVKKGVSPDRINTQGIGSIIPLLENNSLNNKTKNRRVEIRFTE